MGQDTCSKVSPVVDAGYVVFAGNQYNGDCQPVLNDAVHRCMAHPVYVMQQRLWESGLSNLHDHNTHPVSVEHHVNMTQRTITTTLWRGTCPSSRPSGTPLGLPDLAARLCRLRAAHLPGTSTTVLLQTTYGDHSRFSALLWQC